MFLKAFVAHLNPEQQSTLKTFTPRVEEGRLSETKKKREAEEVKNDPQHLKVWKTAKLMIKK
jgi:hypothetical protein